VAPNLSTAAIAQLNVAATAVFTLARVFHVPPGGVIVTDDPDVSVPVA
jgi:hypothetical protein